MSPPSASVQQYTAHTRANTLRASVEHSNNNLMRFDHRVQISLVLVPFPYVWKWLNGLLKSCCYFLLICCHSHKWFCCATRQRKMHLKLVFLHTKCIKLVFISYPNCLPLHTKIIFLCPNFMPSVNGVCLIKSRVIRLSSLPNIISLTCLLI